MLIQAEDNFGHQLLEVMNCETRWLNHLWRKMAWTLIGLGLIGADPLIAAENSSRSISIVLDSACGPPARHGVARLQSALESQGWTVHIAPSVDAASANFIVVAGSSKSAGAAAQWLRQAGETPPSVAEGIVIR